MLSFTLTGHINVNELPYNSAMVCFFKGFSMKLDMNDACICKMCQKLSLLLFVTIKHLEVTIASAQAYVKESMIFFFLFLTFFFNIFSFQQNKNDSLSFRKGMNRQCFLNWNLYLALSDTIWNCIKNICCSCFSFCYDILVNTLKYLSNGQSVATAKIIQAFTLTKC